MAPNQNRAATPITMDSRKFLGALNDSAQSKIAFFEDRIKEMGLKGGKDWKLTALRNNDLFIEDKTTNTYYIANHNNDRGNISITNIRPITIKEGEKQQIFEDSCVKLINAIEENNQQGMQNAFSKMKAHRFSGRSIPHSGVIQSKDGVIRHINVTTNESLNEETRNRLVSAIVEGLNDKVIVENGQVISAQFNSGGQIKLPVTKWASRKLVAKKMMESAQNAYWSQGFQTRIKNIAELISEGKIEQAVKEISPFLNEMEEFTLLTRSKAQTLVENALAANAIFNQELCNDTATLFYRTNLRINRSKIIDEWRNIARKSEHPVLAENVQTLSESKNFEASFDKFLELIFEAISNKDVAAQALATTLEVLREKTPRIKESHELSGKLNTLITRLQDRRGVDDAAIYEAEDLIATIQEELAANENLQNFDQMPGDTNPALSGLGDEIGDADGDMGLDIGSDDKSTGQAPIININSPLIQIGGSSAAGGTDTGLGDEDLDLGGDDELGDELGDDEFSQDEEGELADILGGGGPQAGGGQGMGGAQGNQGGGLGFESRTRRGKALKESRPIHHEMARGEDFGLEADYADTSDPYAVKSTKKKKVKSEGLTNYGAPVITDQKDLNRIVQIMEKLAKEHKLSGSRLNENLESLAEASIKAIGIRIPEGRMGAALDQTITMFNESYADFTNYDDDSGENTFGLNRQSKGRYGEPGIRGVGRRAGKLPLDTYDMDNEDEDEDDLGTKWPEDEAVQKADFDPDFPDDIDYFGDDEEDNLDLNDQFKGPRIRGRGFRKTSYAPRELKNESIKWGEAQEDAMAGRIGGVNFIFDHGGSDDKLRPVILSEDGAVEIPLPKQLYEHAFAAANMSENGDPSKFKSWLVEHLEQLRPITMEEDRALSEAMAKIRATPDGGLEVEVSDDIEVGEIGDEVPGDEVPDEMEPVDTVITEPDETIEEPEPLGDDEMPDFEGGEETEEGPPEDLEGLEEPEDQVAPEGEEEGQEEGEEDEEEPTFEDKDFTEPTSAKYTKHVKDNKRDMPEHKPTKKTDDKLDSLGPDLKKDDGTGTKPPISRS